MSTTRLGTAGLGGVVARGAVVIAAMRRSYEPRLWREETQTQLSRLVTGRRAGTVDGRDHDGTPARCYRSRSGEPPLWLRPGTGDGAVWGEVNARGVYQAPWPIPAGARVLDLGGHAGYFARWALAHWPLRTVLSVEPDQANLELLSRNVAALADDRWTWLHAAAGTEPGTASFAGGRGCGSGLSADGEDTVQIVDAMPLLAAVDFAKIDIEGAEWALLADARFGDCAPPMLVLEYHPASAFPDPAAEARRRLQEHGFEVHVGHPEEVPGVGVLWGRRADTTRPPRASA
jgi:FkbM family methyltransferase